MLFFVDWVIDGEEWSGGNCVFKLFLSVLSGNSLFEFDYVFRLLNCYGVNWVGVYVDSIGLDIYKGLMLYDF